MNYFKCLSVRLLLSLMVVSWAGSAVAKPSPFLRPKPGALKGKPIGALLKVKPPVPSKASVNQKLINAAIKKNSANGKNGSIFWSGQTATVNPKLEAEKMANKLNAKHPKINHTSLEMLVDKSKVKLPRGAGAWKTSSENFAKDSSGKVRIVLGPNPRPNSVLNRLEVPQLTKPLKDGGKVNQINVFQVNKDTGVLEKKHRWFNDGTPWNGPGSSPDGKWTPSIAPKKK